jgi:hypothetical protein
MSVADKMGRPELTIVGGQPSKRGGGVRNVPTGIEKVLCEAARDEGFRRRLIDDRQGSLESMTLSDSERAALGAVPDSALEAMIAGYHPGK